MKASAKKTNATNVAKNGRGKTTAKKDYAPIVKRTLDYNFKYFAKDLQDAITAHLEKSGGNTRDVWEVIADLAEFYTIEISRDLPKFSHNNEVFWAE